MTIPSIDDLVELAHARLVEHRFLPAAMTVERWHVLRVALQPVFDAAPPIAGPVPAVDDLVSDPSTPHWVRRALTLAMDQDAVDAATSAATMARALAGRADRLMGAGDGD